MRIWHGWLVNTQLLHAMAGIFAVLTVATLIGQVLRLRFRSPQANATIKNLNQRLAAWWWMTLIFGATLLSGETVSLVLFAIISFLALREYITLIPTRRGDHLALFWSFFVITPLQYCLIGKSWYGMFAIFIPVWVFLLLPTRMAIAGDTEHFLERATKVQWGLMVCVYCVSYAPALLMLKLPGAQTGAKLLLYLVVVDQMSDVLQYCWGKLTGRHQIAPLVSPNKTLEGTIGGGLSAVALGVALRGLTPFSAWAAAGISLAIVVMGFAGGLTMSAVKRDRGVKDYGSMIRGHGGMLDRIDSLCFAAPVFFHLVRYFYVQ